MKLSASPLKIFDTLEGYKQYFTDLILWEPYVREVCRLQGLACPEVHPTLPGTYPTFFAGDKVIKFFGQLFDGEHTFSVEREAARLLAADPSIPVPALRGEGILLDWHYLVYDIVPGESIGLSSASQGDKLFVARWLAQNVRRIHNLSLDDSTLFHPDPDIYRAFLEKQYQNINRSTLPSWIVNSLPDYLLSLEDLLQDRPTPYLIHADLTRDHILGLASANGWRPNGIIDFGDAMAGDIYYELIALHLDLFNCDKHLLKEFLKSYGFIPPVDFPRRAVNMTLLHNFDVLGYILGLHPELQKIRSIEELASILWDISEI
jgi:hygromycin-B 7''-O-kinase